MRKYGLIKEQEPNGVELTWFNTTNEPTIANWLPGHFRTKIPTGDKKAIVKGDTVLQIE